MSSTYRGARLGTQFGPYELRSLIGVGGMGEVYRAHDTIKGRMVAVKVLRTELAADPSFQERFRRESRMAARLQEPHVIPVHDFGDIRGVLFIDMRLVDGGSLKDLLRAQGALEPMRAAKITAQVAAALDAAHAEGLVHRDVKPENVLLTSDDFAYLVDFGIAHAGGDASVTASGSLVGSCAYMATERFTEGRVGPQADVYSLACVLYECLTGRPPFEHEELQQLMGAHIFTPPPRPSIMRRGIGRAFDDVIARGMAKDPAARFSSAGELARAATEAASIGPGAGSNGGSSEPKPNPADEHTAVRVGLPKSGRHRLQPIPAACTSTCQAGPQPRTAGPLCGGGGAVGRRGDAGGDIGFRQHPPHFADRNAFGRNAGPDGNDSYNEDAVAVTSRAGRRWARVRRRVGPLRSGRSAGDGGANRPVARGGVSNRARQFLLPRRADKRWRQHRTRQRGAHHGRIRRHQPGRRHPLRGASPAAEDHQQWSRRFVGTRVAVRLGHVEQFSPVPYVADRKVIVDIGVESDVPAGASRSAVYGAEYHFCPAYY